MDQSYSESDVSLSPSQILDRLQVLRRLQFLQRGKLQKQRLEYQETPETSSSITEIVSHFSNSTSYNTFRSLLQSSYDISNDVTPRQSPCGLTPKVKEHDLIEGVSVLNLSQESEFIVNSPLSTKSRISTASRTEQSSNDGSSNRSTQPKVLTKKQIALDEMPILSPKQDFESLVLEKLKNEKVPKSKSPMKDAEFTSQSKKPFLRRGEGMNRFGLKKNNLVIQSTKSLPWRRKSLQARAVPSPQAKKLTKKSKDNKKVDIQILVTKPKLSTSTKNEQPATKVLNTREKLGSISESEKQEKDCTETTVDSSNCEIHNVKKPVQKVLQQKKHPLIADKRKTWAAVLTKEQDDFLRQLKQSDYYKNFVSPAKSTHSDMSCDENLLQLRYEREIAEQNMFELLENKVTNESFNINNSFITKFLKRNNFECSGESTPLIMQKCLSNNPQLLHLFPDLHQNRAEIAQSDAETCDSEYTECCSDNCSSVSSCCSCKTVEPANNSTQSYIQNKEVKKKVTIQKPEKTKSRKEVANTTENKCHDKTVTEDDIMKANMAEMNAKLVATSELLKDRLQELEDEIETFRNENTNLAKLREEVDLERQKFYEEKNAFEQKFNEEKILSEYYLAEEKEKLTKQKQTYERYVREMRGRLNKKEKDEVINLKKEINDLKEEIRLKDAKSTSTIARLRNQIKIMEKEKKDMLEEVEKLKKENRRIQHSNDVTRRLTNLKYLEQINKKLTNMSKETRSEVNVDNDVKYKAFEIERQSRSRRVQPIAKNNTRPRAKSVPNLNIKSRYAKYFSQRDAVSQIDRTNFTVDRLVEAYHNDVDDIKHSDDSVSEDSEVSDHDDENYLEKIYLERFQSSPTSDRSSLSNTEKNNFQENPDSFFIRRTNTALRDSKSPNENTIPPVRHNNSSSNTNRSKSPTSTLSHRSSHHLPTENYTKDIQNISNYSSESNLQKRSKSPISILSNRSSSQRLSTVINQDQYKDRLVVSPEPSTSKTSLEKTSLNPTEIKKPDGSRELRFPNGNVKYISADGKYSRFAYYNGDVKENFFNEGRIKYFYAETKAYHTTHADGLEVLEFPDGQVEKRYKDGSSEIRLPNGSIRYYDPKNEHVREEWRFPDGTALTISGDGEQRITFNNGQVEVHAKDHKRREFPDGTVKLVYTDGTSETRYASGRVRIKDKHGNLIMDSAPG